MSQWQSAGDKLRAILDERDLGARTFARMLAKDAGQETPEGIEKERRRITRQLSSGQTFQKEIRLRYARVLELPPDYFKVKTRPRRTEVDRLLAQARELLLRAEELESRFDQLEEQSAPTEKS